MSQFVGDRDGERVPCEVAVNEHNAVLVVIDAVKGGRGIVELNGDGPCVRRRRATESQESALIPERQRGVRFGDLFCARRNEGDVCGARIVRRIDRPIL